MKQEELLEHLLARSQEAEPAGPVEQVEVAACLQAAERLRQVKQVAVPAAFAHRLEQSLRARLRSSPSLQRNGRVASNRGVIVIAGRRRSIGARRPQKRRPWIALLGTAAALVLSFMSLFAFSAHSLPGDPFYGLKQAQNQFPLIFEHDPQARVQAEIALLQSALADLRTVVNDRRDDDALTLALKTVAARTSECQAAVAEVPAGNERTSAQQDLSQVLAQEVQTLRQLLPSLDWPLRVLFTHQLGVLGEAVPTVTRVQVQALANGTVLITLTGTHFAPLARFMLNGRPAGHVNSVTAEQLVVILNSSEFSPKPRAFGVLNPDGTAAQIQGDDDGDDYNEPGGNYNPSGTPVTPGSDRDANDYEEGACSSLAQSLPRQACVAHGSLLWAGHG